MAYSQQHKQDTEVALLAGFVAVFHPSICIFLTLEKKISGFSLGYHSEF